jgi:hypothetical protein
LLVEAVAALAEPARTIVVLRWFRGLDSAEIARELAMPAGTVRWRLKRALEELRADLDRRAGGREAWVGLLAPLARGSSSAALATASATAPWLFVLTGGGLALAILGGTFLPSAFAPEEPEQREATGIVAGSPEQTALPVSALLTSIDSPARSAVALAPQRTGRAAPGTDGPSASPDEPELTGRVLMPGGGAPIPEGNFSGWFQHVVPSNVAFFLNPAGVFSTDAEGRFHIPLACDADVAQVRLLVEIVDVGRKVVDVPEFECRGGFDVGDVVLDPGAAVTFRVLDENGEPLAEALARISDWDSLIVESDWNGDGVLACVPEQGARVRFSSQRHRDQVVFVRPGDRPEVVLERTNALQITLVDAHGDLLQELHLRISPREGVFLDTGDFWSNVVHDEIVFLSPPGAARSHSMSSVADSDAEVLLRDLAPGQPFTIEVCTPDGRSLAVRDCVLGEREWQELVIPIER